MIMTKNYIETHFSDIKKYANTIEKRLDDSDLTMEDLIKTNSENLAMCKKYDCNYLLIDETYNFEEDLHESRIK